MKRDLKDTTVVIPLRIESADRMRNVITSLCYILSNFDTQIIVKEVAEHPVFAEDVLPQIKEFLEVEEIPNLTHVFEKTDRPEFHKTRILNELFAMATTKVALIYDCDVILPLEIYTTAQNMITEGDSDVVYPYGLGKYARPVFVNDEIVSEFLTEGFSIELLDQHSKVNDARNGYCQFFDREKYFEGGGQNENFIAYAPEDDEIAFRFQTLGYNVDRTDTLVYHLEHSRTPNSWYNNPHIQRNFAIWEEVKVMNREQLIEYYNLSL